MISLERLVAGDGVDLSVWEVGDKDSPTVVLVHGYPDTHVVWNAVADRLAERFHVVTYDVRGSGTSGAPRSRRSGWTLAHLEADLAAVIDATSPDRPVHLVGHDWGSIQSWEAVTGSRLTGRLASFTSISGPCLDHVGFWIRDRVAPRTRGLRQLAGQGARSWYIYAFQLPFLAPLAWRGLARSYPRLQARVEGLDPDDGGIGRTLAADGARGVRLYRANMLQRTTRPRPRRTAIPVQVIVPMSDPFVSPALTEDLVRWVPRLWRREVPGGHWIVRRHPDRVARWIEELIDHAEGGVEAPALRRARAGRSQPDAGRVVVVTGAGSGIGRATALAFAERGAEVFALDINDAAAGRTAELCGLAGGHATPVAVDVGDTAAMEAFAKSIERDHHAPDIVVNNAGIGIGGPMLATSLDDWDRILHVNLWGVIHGSRLFGAQMVARGEGGHIVNTASAAAFTPSRAYPAYATTKAAVLMLSECLRAELAGEGIGVSAICPGLIDTAITRTAKLVGVGDAEAERRRRAINRIYRLRNFPPDRVAAAIVDAVERNRAVVPVAPEAQLMQLLSRFAPGVMRRMARVEMPH